MSENLETSGIERVILKTIGHSSMPPQQVLAHIAKAQPPGTMNDSLEGKCQQALQSITKKGLLRIVDSSVLQELREAVMSKKVIGPLRGLPDIGDLDFTEKGAQLYKQLFRGGVPDSNKPLFETFMVPTYLHERHFFAQDTSAAAFIDEVRQSAMTTTVRGPSPIGKWRGHWWEQYWDGYTVDCETTCNLSYVLDEMPHKERKSTKSDRLENQCFLPQLSIEPGRFRAVLRNKGLAPSEWLVLSVVGSGISDTAESVAFRPVREIIYHVALPVSEEDCRAAVGACIENGWIQLVTRQVHNSIQEMLRQQPAIGPLESLPRPEQHLLDFTPSGAAFFQEVHRELFGANVSYSLLFSREREIPIWAKGVNFTKRIRSKERMYAFGSTEELNNELRLLKRLKKGESIGSPVEVGPWCIHWWNVYPNGHQVDFERNESSNDETRN